MRYTLWILLLSAQVFSFDVVTASLIYEKILHAISSKNSINIYTHSPKYQKVIQSASSLELVANIQDADILLLTDITRIPKNINRKIAFSDSRIILSEVPSVVGSFYWEHGRPKIIFLKKRLDEYKITLDPTFHKYLLETLP